MKDSQELPLTEKPVVTVPVLVPLPTPAPYSYAVPEDVQVRPGSIVQVPLGPRQVAGIVWDAKTDEVEAKKLRPISQVFDCPPIAADMRRFLDWVAAYTLSPPGMVARMALRAPAAFEPEAPGEGLRITDLRPERMTSARARVIELAEDGLAWTRSGLAHAAGVSLSVVDGLNKQGVFETVFIPPQPIVPLPDPDFRPPELSPDQQQAVDSILLPGAMDRPFR